MDLVLKSAQTMASRPVNKRLEAKQGNNIFKGNVLCSSSCVTNNAEAAGPCVPL